MSYDISLRDPATGQTIELAEPHHETGGTYAVGGTTEAWLNVTYNYGRHFARVLGEGGIRRIYGMTGEASIPILEAARDALGTDTDPDYWKPTEGNARQAIESLIRLARLAPRGVWHGD